MTAKPQTLDEIYRYIIVEDLGGTPPPDITLGVLLLAMGAAFSGGAGGQFFPLSGSPPDITGPVVIAGTIPNMDEAGAQVAIGDGSFMPGFYGPVPGAARLGVFQHNLNISSIYDWANTAIFDMRIEGPVTDYTGLLGIDVVQIGLELLNYDNHLTDGFLSAVEIDVSFDGVLNALQTNGLYINAILSNTETNSGIVSDFYGIFVGSAQGTSDGMVVGEANSAHFQKPFLLPSSGVSIEDGHNWSLYVDAGASLATDSSTGRKDDLISILGYDDPTQPIYFKVEAGAFYVLFDDAETIAMQLGTTTGAGAVFGDFVQPSSFYGAGPRHYCGVGAPAVTDNRAGDFYFNTSQTSGQRIYQASAPGTWGGIL